MSEKAKLFYALERELAVEAAISDIESFTGRDPGMWYDIDTACGEHVAVVARAVQYLDLLGRLERDSNEPNQVRILTDATATDLPAPTMPLVAINPYHPNSFEYAYFEQGARAALPNGVVAVPLEIAIAAEAAFLAREALLRNEIANAAAGGDAVAVTDRALAMRETVSHRIDLERLRRGL
jgi:hypothetical protein